MTAPNFPACLDVILQSEGGFTTSLKDGTVATNMGITLATLSAWLGRPASVAEVKALTVDTASQIYRRNYWEAVCGDQLPAGLDLMVFDCAVNQGTETAARILQDSLSVTKDGVIGPTTLAAVAHANIPKLIDRIVQLRADFYHGLRLFPLYGAGWMARLYRTAALAHGMAVLSTPAAPQEAPLPDPAPIAVTVTQPAPAPVPPPAITPLATTPAKPPVSIPFRITLGTAGGAVVAGGAALAVSHPVTAVDLSPLLTPLIQIAGLVLTGLVGWAATRVAAYAHISSQNSLLQSVLAAVDRGINYGQQVATAAAQKDATVNVTSATQAAAVQYVTSKLPGTLAKLGMTPAHVADLVLAKLPSAT